MKIKILVIPAVAIISSLLSCSTVTAQGPLRQFLMKRMQQSQANTANSPNTANDSNQTGTGESDNHASIAAGGRFAENGTKRTTLAGLHVAFWEPSGKGPFPLVIFSHGFHGVNSQSAFYTSALAKAGYLVVAPNHKDAMAEGGPLRPAVPFQKIAQWNDNTYRDRYNDIVKLIDALHKDPQWNSKIDWSTIVLSGHSLGGYTALGLAGAWPAWKLPNVKAVVALSPYCEPFILDDTLEKMGLPIMYQGGTKDLGITPSLKRPNGAFAKTSAPCEFVEFDDVSHFDFSNMGKDEKKRVLINHYALAFLDKYVKGNRNADPEKKLTGVTILSVK